jgi:N-dimethylarginine dimethylaminohydrolase
MSITDEEERARAERPLRTPRARSVLMCPPEHFDVVYRINPWMNPGLPTDTPLAMRQWEELHRLYVALGFEVQLIEPLAGLPDMVYAANGGFVIGNVAYGASFAYPERQPEGPAYRDWLRTAGFEVVAPHEVNEGEGDFLLVGETILAGTGFRSSDASHRELAGVFGREVLTLRLVDPSFYHLDTALAVLDDAPGREHIAYLPRAFDAGSRALLAERYPDAILVDGADAAVLGLNAYSDGYHVVIASRAVGFARQLRDHGYEPIGVDLSELLLGGGGVKCCTLELRR